MASSRTEKLRAWRQETGRTPMKRPSYVVECAAHPHPSVATPSLGVGSKHIKQPMAPLRAPLTPHPVRRGPSYREEGVRKGLSSRENCPLMRQKRKEETRPSTGQRGRSLTKLELSQMRRKMLEEWRAKNGRTLKRPPLFLNPVIRAEKPAGRRAVKRRHTIGGFGCGVVGWNARGKAERDLLKERLQQEIAEDYAAEMEEEGGEEEGEEMGRGWEPHTTPRSESKDEKKEKENNEDSSDGFRSRKVRFMLSEPRKRSHTSQWLVTTSDSTSLQSPRRRSCCASLTPVPTPRTLYLTPVRRSTREGRNCHGPGMKLDAERCYDSPSEVSKMLEFDDLHIITNTMLQ